MEGDKGASPQKRVWASEESRKRQEAARARDREIGRILTDARLLQRRIQRDCARAAGVSRGQYQSIEKGLASLTVGQLERLMQFLDLPLHELLRPLAHVPVRSSETESSGSSMAAAREGSTRVAVRARPGESVQVVLDVHVQPVPQE
jgi:transcriptional regulator with XRE-family HTH domain